MFTACGDDPAPKKRIITNIPEINFPLYSSIDSAVIAKKAIELDKKFKRLQRLTGFNGTVLQIDLVQTQYLKHYSLEDMLVFQLLKI